MGVEQLVPILSMQIKDATWIAMFVGVIVSSLFEFISKNHKPWTFIFRQLGKAINSSVEAKLDENTKKIDEISEQIEFLKAEDERTHRELDEKDASDTRRRILRFADECRMNIDHSQEYFNDILEDISSYKNYCKKHSYYSNDKANIAISRIEKVYEQCLEKDNFL